MTFSHSIAAGRVRIQFSGKPAESVRRMLKANGFRWQRAACCWKRFKVPYAADILAALDRMIGPRRPDGACGVPKPGRLLPAQGAATSVYCDACHSKHQAQTHADPLGVDAAYEDACRNACGL